MILIDAGEVPNASFYDFWYSNENLPPVVLHKLQLPVADNRLTLHVCLIESPHLAHVSLH